MRENGMIEPLHSVYKRDALHSACQNAIEHGERKIRLPLSMLRVKYVAVELLKNPDPELLTFFNLNTREDLDLARSLWSKR
jgi:molybdopterin-guanine dinucleotide biosynthesis protein A